MVSVVIAAHNEEAVLGACLDALLDQQGPEPIEIIVSANGCTDATAAVAASRGVRIIDRREPGKPGALNAADEVAAGYPRIYLDADILVPAGGIHAVVSRLDGGSLAAVPRRRVDTSGRPVLVKAYFAINERLPVFRDGLFGRGMIAVSREGRERFGRFPTMIADDLFLDSQYNTVEKAEAREVEVVVEAPFTTRDLLKRLVRVRRGNAEMRAASAEGTVEVAVRKSDKWAWLRDVVARKPSLAFAAIPYLSITVAAGVLARRPAKVGNSWGRDESTRTRHHETGLAKAA